MKLVDKIISWGLYLFIILLPWQTRWIFKDVSINGGVFEYGRLSLYASEIILLVILFLGLIRFRNSKTYFWIGWLAVWSALTILWSEEKILASYGWLKLAEGISLFWLINQQKHRQGLSFSLIISGLIQAAFGIYQFLNQGIVGANKWLGLAMINSEAAGTSVIEFLDQRWLRAYGSLPHPNILGGFLALTLILTIFSLWRFYQQTSSMTIIPKKLYWLTVFYWFSLGVMFLGLVVTFSRGAWLAFLAALLYLVFHSLKNKLKMEKTVLLKTAVLFILILGTFLIGFPRQLFTARLTAQGRLERYSIQERLTSFGQAKEIFKQSPIWGNGLGNYTVALQKIKPNQWVWAYQPVHNWYLLALGELGVMGLLLLLILLFHFFKSAGAASRSLLILLLTIGLFDHYLWSLYFGLIFVWLILALTKKHETTG